ncbi:TPA: IS5/IS1182 family transposase, partial [Vibrio parahaemolyticus]
MPKPRYKTTNWKQSKQNKRGRPRRFSDLAITTA